MINNTRAEYIFIRVCVVSLQSIAYIAVLYCAYLASALIGNVTGRPNGTWRGPWTRLPIPLEVWLALEATWAIIFERYRNMFLQKEAQHPPLRNKEERQVLWKRIMDNTDKASAEENLRYWFKDASIEDIGRENMKKWLAWALFENRVEEHSGDGNELEMYLVDLERLLGRKLPKKGEAAQGNRKPLLLTLDRVDTAHRSLLWYWCVGFVDFLVYVKLWWKGYHFHRQPYRQFFNLFPFRPIALLATKQSPAKDITYWHRPHTAKNRLPVVFIHGIGIGLYPYVNFLGDLLQHVDDEDEGQVGIIAIELMPISFRLTKPMLGKDEMCKELLKILNHHQFDEFVLISHSYGSVLSTHILHNKSLQPRVSSVLLIDPVTFMLHTPSVAYNFTVRKPKEANEWQLWYFASQDPMVAHTLGRHFFWADNVLWLEDLMPMVKKGMRVTASLAGRDLIADTEFVGRCLAGQVTSVKLNGSSMNGASYGTMDDAKSQSWKNATWHGRGLEILWFEDTDHAQVFDKKERRARLVHVVQSYCRGKTEGKTD